MSQRSIRRAQQRRAAADERRETLRRRRALLATGAAIGATALFAPAAQAANLVVNSEGDHAADACDSECTLRDATETSNGNSAGDVITFADDVTGTIRLTEGRLRLLASEATIIAGPGAEELSISGDANDDGALDSGDSQIFVVANGPATISGVTLTGGNTYGSGGAIAVSGGSLALVDAAVTGNSAGNAGGAVGVPAGAGSDITITRSNLTGNVAQRGGAIDVEPSPSQGLLTVTDSTLSANTATGSGGGAISTTGRATITGSVLSNNTVEGENNGGGAIFTTARLSLTDSEISGNTATASGGGILVNAKYATLTVRDSEITGNSAARGGGDEMSIRQPKYGSDALITGTTIAGNDATESGAGMFVGGMTESDHVRIHHSTISGNDAHDGTGGWLTIQGPTYGQFEMSASTVSGNTAHDGAGVQIGTNYAGGYEQEGSIDFHNSTIASNTAAGSGGGIRLEGYAYDEGQHTATVPLTSTIVADNAPQDLEQVEATAGGFDLSFSLIEQPGNAPLFQSTEAPSIIGQDPQLGPLADNGGPTLTHLPARTSPAIEHGHGGGSDTDQRGQQRIVDNEDANPENGDGADIGAVELDKPPPKPMPENPPPEEQPPQQQPPENPPDANPPNDLPPQALIRKNGLRAKKDADRVVSGVADDDHEVTAVDVAIVRKRGGMCKQLLPSGKFTKFERCHGPKSFLPAEGTTKWRFELKDALDRGYYVVYSRATDDSGRKQLSFGTKSRRPFRVR